MNFNISDALISLRPGANFVTRGEEIEFYQHADPQPTEAEIRAEITRLEAAQPMVELRQQRNRLIAETDYLALSDATMTDEMSTYRQALRDLPANTTDPANPVWPTKPGA
jgi:hypothetical protein